MYIKQYKRAFFFHILLNIFFFFGRNRNVIIEQRKRTTVTMGWRARDMVINSRKFAIICSVLPMHSNFSLCVCVFFCFAPNATKQIHFSFLLIAGKSSAHFSAAFFNFISFTHTIIWFNSFKFSFFLFYIVLSRTEIYNLVSNIQFISLHTTLLILTNAFFPFEKKTFNGK